MATLGTKGRNFLTCNQDYAHGENVMSIAYCPGSRPLAPQGNFYIAWEQGKGSNQPWVPAACNFYINVDFATVLAL